MVNREEQDPNDPPPSISGYGEVATIQDPVLFWSFAGGATDGTIEDHTGNGNVGIIPNDPGVAVGLDSTPIFDTASYSYQYNNPTTPVNLPYSTSIAHAGALSFSLMLDWPGGAPASPVTILEKPGEFALRHIDLGGGQNYLELYMEGILEGSPFQHSVYCPLPPVGDYGYESPLHVACILAFGDQRIYLNGGIQNVTSGDSNADSAPVEIPSSGDLRLGLGVGKMSNFGFWDRALTEAEVWDQWNNRNTV